jgi:hypothetical protein
MNKTILSLALIVTTLTQPALASHSGSKHPPVATTAVMAPEKTVAVCSAHSQCKKYFPLIGALVAVPC